MPQERASSAKENPVRAAIVKNSWMSWDTRIPKRVEAVLANIIMKMAVSSSCCSGGGIPLVIM